MSKLLYEAFESPYLKNIISDVQKASAQLGIDFFGVGALARNVWYVSNDKESRGTKDVDFGVYVPNSKVYSQLKKLLIKDFAYTVVSTNAFCLMSPYGIPLDLLPFGEIEENDKVIIEGTGLVDINLDGFKDTYRHGLITTEIEEDTLKVCSIPSVVLLKLIAFDDRPEKRHNDPLDIDSILKHYPDIETTKIWSEYNFLYDDEIPHEEVGIKVLGYELSKLILENKALTDRVLSILDMAIKEESPLAQRMIQDAEIETVEQKIQNLKIMKEGIEEGLSKADKK